MSTTDQPWLLRPSPADSLLIAVAVLGVSASGPIIAATAAPALAIAMWRNAMGTAALAPLALTRHRSALLQADARERRLLLVSGLALAAHFATWVPAVTLTSVASATALGATSPVWNALIARLSGQYVPRRVWLGIGVALLGVLVLTGVDLQVSGDALVGDLLALAGGMFAAVYVAVGGAARQTLSTTSYAFACYAICAVVLLAVCLVGGVQLAGYSADTWLKLVVLTVVAQLLGHTIFNRVVGSVGPVVVSLCILFEVPGAALIAAIWLGQVPPLAALPAAVLVLAGVALVVTGRPAKPSDID